MLKKLFLLIIAFSLCSTEAIALTADQWALIINLSGRQRMLTQKMSKEIMLIANDYDTTQTKTKLKDTAEDFERNLDRLINGDSASNLPKTESTDIRNKLNEVSNLWKEFKTVVDAALSGCRPQRSRW